MKRKNALLHTVAVMLLAFCLVFAMTACGGSGGSSTDDSTGGSGQEPPSSSGTEEPDDEGSGVTPDADDPSTWVDGNCVIVPSEVNQITAEIVNQLGSSIQKVDMSSCSVLTIAANAFKNMISLQEVILPANVTIQDGSELGRSTVPSGAFAGCSNLQKVIFLGSGTTNIGKYAFANCNNLETVSFSASTKVGESAFQYCMKLNEIVGSENVTSIGARSFFNCLRIEEIDLSGLQGNLPDGAFGVCKRLKKVVLSDQSTEIGFFVFNACEALEDINLEKVKYIRDGAFLECTSLKIADLQSISSLGRDAFKNSGLTYIRFSDSVNDVASEALATTADKVYVYYGKDKTTDQLIERLYQVENWEDCGLFYSDNVEDTKIDGVLNFNQWESDMAVIKDLSKPNQSLADWFTF